MTRRHAAPAPRLARVVLRALLLAPALLVACVRPSARGADPSSATAPADVAASLLAADRALAAAGADDDPATSLARAFADSVLLLAPGARVVHGRDSAVAALRASPANAGARLTWSPIRAGVASDGAHGFTIGYWTATRADGATQPGKYVAFWRRGADGWRMLAYKRVPRPAGDVSTALLPPSLPARLGGGLPAAEVARAAAALDSTERAFAREGAAGLPAAFARYATPDADHTGGGADAGFVHGPEAVARSLAAGGDGPSDIAWAPTHTLVATSGDLGANVGFIELGGRRVPFLSIWRRAGPGAPWRWIAE